MCLCSHASCKTHACFLTCHFMSTHHLLGLFPTTLQNQYTLQPARMDDDPSSAAGSMQRLAISTVATAAPADHPAQSSNAADRTPRTNSSSSTNIKQILHGMRDHPSDVGKQLEGLAALESLSSQPAHAKALCANGGCAIIIAALKAFPSDVELQGWGLTCVTELAAHPDGQRSLGEAAACEATLATVISTDLWRVRRWAVKALAALRNNNATNQARFRAAGVCAAVCSALRHEDTCSLRHQELLAAASELCDNPTDARALATAGICDTLVALMTSLQDDADLQHAAAMFCWNLAASGAEGCEAAVSAGMCTTIVHAMRTHPDNADVIMSGCAAC